MSLTFTSDARPPSNIRLLPGGFLRPAFGTLYGFDADADAAGTLRATYDTQSNIEARTGYPVGTLYYAYDSDRLYVYDGSNWQFYTST